MDIRTAQDIIGKFGIRHNTDTFMETIELLDDYNLKGMLSDTEKTAYFLIIDEYAEYYSN